MLPNGSQISERCVGSRRTYNEAEDFFRNGEIDPQRFDSNNAEGCFGFESACQQQAFAMYLRQDWKSK